MKKKQKWYKFSLNLFCHFDLWVDKSFLKNKFKQCGLPIYYWEAFWWGRHFGSRVLIIVLTIKNATLERNQQNIFETKKKLFTQNLRLKVVVATNRFYVNWTFWFKFRMSIFYFESSLSHHSKVTPINKGSDYSLCIYDHVSINRFIINKN